ncbi:MAG: hypothetical protein ACXW3V_01655 [Methylocystis sp.]
MISGFDTLRRIDAAYAEARDYEMRISTALSAASERSANLRRDRLSQLNALAHLKFELIRRGELVTHLDAAERQAKATLAEIHQDIEQAANRREAAVDALRRAEAEKTKHARDYEGATFELQNIERKAASEVESDLAWRGVTERVASLQKTLAQAQAKAAQAEADRARKRSPYEQDPLFMYLWARKYGAPDYQARAFTRYMDGLVARLIRFREARQNYETLNRLPTRLHEHAADVAAALAAEQQRFAVLQQSAIERAGGAPLQEKARAAKAALAASEAERAAAAGAFEQANSRYFLLIGKDNEGRFGEVIKLMQENDARDTVVTLYREAARTTTPEDQTIVETIDKLTKAIDKVDADVVGLRRMLEAGSTKRAELERARADFHARDYDRPGTSFGNESTISDVLGGILTGAIAGAVLGQVLGQGYRRPPSPPWGGSFDSGTLFPPGGFFGGSSNEDDFSTGGGF